MLIRYADDMPALLICAAAPWARYARRYAKAMSGVRRHTYACHAAAATAHRALRDATPCRHATLRMFAAIF